MIKKELSNIYGHLNLNVYTDVDIVNKNIYVKELVNILKGEDVVIRRYIKNDVNDEFIDHELNSDELSSWFDCVVVLIYVENSCLVVEVL